MTETQMQKLDKTFDIESRYQKVRAALIEEGYRSTWRTYVNLAQSCRIECFVANSGPVVIVQQWSGNIGIEVYRPMTDEQSMVALFDSIKVLRPQAAA